ncbi:MAG: hypothetical protein M3Y54_22700 [Bacteroidota bacterium]|nr:hypothetical protein [Bacteroidota bacterium]
MKLLATFSSLFSIILLGSRLACAQSAEHAMPQPAAAQLQQQYAQSSIDYPVLYNGPEYGDYTAKYHTRDGHPFFLQPDVQTGTLRYQEHDFANVRLQYDLVLDQVVLNQPNGTLRLRLLNEKVQAFTIDQHSFVRLVPDSASAAVMRAGYYEVLAEGPVQVLARRSKRLQEHLNLPYIDVEFVASNRLLMQQGGHYFAIGSKRAALRLLAGHTREVQQYLKAQQLRFGRAQLENSVVALARYYNSLP